jgi:hypothetical protein
LYFIEEEESQMSLIRYLGSDEDGLIRLVASTANNDIYLIEVERVKDKGLSLLSQKKILSGNYVIN